MVMQKAMITRGFTMIELLIVVAIMVILIGLMITGLTHVRERARELITQTRMQDIQRLVQATGLNSAGAAFHFSNRLSLLSADRNHMVTQLKTLAPLNLPFAEAIDNSVIFAAGKGPANFVFEAPWQQDNGRTLAETMSPNLSFLLLLEAGLLPANDPATTNKYEPAVAYFADRGSDRAWNDAWGGPLVVSYQLFQPRTRAGLAQAQGQWGYNRSLYVSVAAAGPSFEQMPRGVLDYEASTKAWNFVKETLERSEHNWTWTGDDFGRSEDQGIKVFRGMGPTVLISTPSEMR